MKKALISQLDPQGLFAGFVEIDEALIPSCGVAEAPALSSAGEIVKIPAGVFQLPIRDSEGRFRGLRTTMVDSAMLRTLRGLHVSVDGVLMAERREKPLGDLAGVGDVIDDIVGEIEQAVDAAGQAVGDFIPNPADYMPSVPTSIDEVTEAAANAAAQELASANGWSFSEPACGQGYLPEYYFIDFGVYTFKFYTGACYPDPSYVETACVVTQVGSDGGPVAYIAGHLDANGVCQIDDPAQQYCPDGSAPVYQGNGVYQCPNVSVPVSQSGDCPSGMKPSLDQSGNRVCLKDLGCGPGYTARQANDGLWYCFQDCAANEVFDPKDELCGCKPGFARPGGDVNLPCMKPKDGTPQVPEKKPAKTDNKKTPGDVPARKPIEEKKDEGLSWGWYVGGGAAAALLAWGAWKMSKKGKK